MKLTISPIASLAQKCKELNGINLAQGSCNLPIAKSLIELSDEAIRMGHNIYSSPFGLPALRSAIAMHLNNKGYESVNDENIVVTPGGTSALFISYKSFLKAGSEVILFEPFWDYHKNGLELGGYKTRIVKWEPDTESITEEKLVKNISANTSAILLCNPSNPSGRVFTKQETEIILKTARKYSLFIISDEVYDAFVYDEMPHCSFIPHIHTYNNLVVIKSFSKQLFMTGWRVGYTVANKYNSERIAAGNGLLNACASTPFQYAISEYLNTPESISTNHSKTFELKRNRLYKTLKSIGKPLLPQGSFFILLEIENKSFLNSTEAAEDLLLKTGVCAVPGEIFFTETNNKNYLRFCFAVEDKLLEEVEKRLEQVPYE